LVNQTPYESTVRKCFFLVVVELYDWPEIFIKTQDKLNWMWMKNMKKNQDTNLRKNKENLEFDAVVDNVLTYDVSIRKRPT
jgi:hypothetical protein